jgi:hypothetical protein
MSLKSLIMIVSSELSIETSVESGSDVETSVGLDEVSSADVSTAALPTVTPSSELPHAASSAKAPITMILFMTFSLCVTHDDIGTTVPDT